jgi:hypothetical protein
VYVSVLDPSVSEFSLSLYRHPFIYTVFSSRFTLIINNRFSSNAFSTLLNATAERAKLLLMETETDPPFFCTLREFLQARLEQDIRLNSKFFHFSKVLAYSRWQIIFAPSQRSLVRVQGSQTVQISFHFSHPYLTRIGVGLGQLAGRSC